MKAYDSHCHFQSIQNTTDFARARLVVAINSEEWSNLYQLKLRIPQYKIAFGIHPWEVNNYSIDIINTLNDNILKYSPDCIGEIGLDKLKPNFEWQITLFEHQLQLAKKYNLSVSIHCVKAYNETIELLKKYNITHGVIHAYNANSTIANQLTKLGLYIGIGGLITKSTTITKHILNIDIDRIVLESDAPYMPCFDKDISLSSDCDKYAQILAKYHKTDITQIIQISNYNFLNLFRK